MSAVLYLVMAALLISNSIADPCVTAAPPVQASQGESPPGSLKTDNPTGPTEFDSLALPAKARVEFPEVLGRFELTVVAVDTAATIAPAIWQSRR